MSERADRLVSVVHSHSYSSSFEVEHWVNNWSRSISGGVDNLNFASLGNNKVCGFVLVTKGVTADDNGLGPAGDQAGDGLAKDGLTEDSAPEDVADGSVWAGPHLLQMELCNNR